MKQGAFTVVLVAPPYLGFSAEDRAITEIVLFAPSPEAAAAYAQDACHKRAVGRLGAKDGKADDWYVAAIFSGAHEDLVGL